MILPLPTHNAGIGLKPTFRGRHVTEYGELVDMDASDARAVETTAHAAISRISYL